MNDPEELRNSGTDVAGQESSKIVGHDGLSSGDDSSAPEDDKDAGQSTSKFRERWQKSKMETKECVSKPESEGRGANNISSDAQALGHFRDFETTALATYENTMSQLQTDLKPSILLDLFSRFDQVARNLALVQFERDAKQKMDCPRNNHYERAVQQFSAKLDQMSHEFWVVLMKESIRQRQEEKQELILENQASLRRQEEERRADVAEKRRKEEERKGQEQESKRRDEERKLEEVEKRRRDEERKLEEAEKRRREEERKLEEIDRKRGEEETKFQEMEKKAEEAERRLMVAKKDLEVTNMKQKEEEDKAENAKRVACEVTENLEALQTQLIGSQRKLEEIQRKQIEAQNIFVMEKTEHHAEGVKSNRLEKVKSLEAGVRRGASTPVPLSFVKNPARLREVPMDRGNPWNKQSLVDSSGQDEEKMIRDMIEKAEEMINEKLTSYSKGIQILSQEDFMAFWKKAQDAVVTELELDLMSSKKLPPLAAADIIEKVRTVLTSDKAWQKRSALNQENEEKIRRSMERFVDDFKDRTKDIGRVDHGSRRRIDSKKNSVLTDFRLSFICTKEEIKTELMKEIEEKMDKVIEDIEDGEPMDCTQSPSTTASSGTNFLENDRPAQTVPTNGICVNPQRVQYKSLQGTESQTTPAGNHEDNQSAPFERLRRRMLNQFKSTAPRGLCGISRASIPMSLRNFDKDAELLELTGSRLYEVYRNLLKEDLEAFCREQNEQQSLQEIGPDISLNRTRLKGYKFHSNKSLQRSESQSDPGGNHEHNESGPFERLRQRMLNHFKSKTPQGLCGISRASIPMCLKNFDKDAEMLGLADSQFYEVYRNLLKEDLEDYCRQQDEQQRLQEIGSDISSGRNISWRLPAGDFDDLKEKVARFYRGAMDTHFVTPSYYQAQRLTGMHNTACSEAKDQIHRSLDTEDMKELHAVLDQIFEQYEAKNQMNTPTSFAIGIDLGTTYSCVGVYINGNVEIIGNSDRSQKTTPSYVSFDKDNKPIVGEAAKEQAHLQPERTAYEVKRLIGRRLDDPAIQEDLVRWPFKVVNERGAPKVLIGEKTYHPEEISALLLKKLKRDAEDYVGDEVKYAVITVPAYFTDGQRNATKNAGEAAGLHVLRIINEPTAAAIAYNLNWNNSQKPIKGLVYDFGGGTFDVAIFEANKGEIKIIAVGGDTHLGGADFDNEMVNRCIQKFRLAEGEDLEEGKETPSGLLAVNRKRIRMKGVCEKGKKGLSGASETTISMECIYGSKHLNVKITRAEFEAMIDKHVSKSLECVEETLRDAKLRKQDIEEIVLIGGSTRIPKVRMALSEYFGRPVNFRIYPDEAVAYGAAFEAAVLNGIRAQREGDIRSAATRYSVYSH